MVPTRTWRGSAVETDTKGRNDRWTQPRAAAPHGRDRRRAESHRYPAILIASPSSDARRRWRRGLEDSFGLAEVATYSDLESAITRCRPDVVVLDVLLLPLDGLGALNRWCPIADVLLMADAPDEAEAAAVLKAGAKGYCPRNGGGALVCQAVQVVQKGGIWIEGLAIARLVSEPRSGASPANSARVPGSGSLEGLTAREIDVARLIARGARNKEIAARLNITEATVKAHLTAVFRKFGLSDRLHLGLLLSQLEQQAYGKDPAKLS